MASQVAQTPWISTLVQPSLLRAGGPTGTTTDASQAPAPVPAPSVSAPTASTAAPVQAAPQAPATQPPAAGTGGEIMSALAAGFEHLASAIMAFFKALFSAGSTSTSGTSAVPTTSPQAPSSTQAQPTASTPSAQPTASTPVSAPVAASPAASSAVPAPAIPSSSVVATPLSAQDTALAQQYGLLATSANVAAFKAELASYSQSGVLAPGSTNTQAIVGVQGQLVRAGYPVQATGQYDQPTQQAVMAFKQAHGLHQTYQMASGAYAINQVLDPATRALLDQLFPAATSPTPAAPSAPAGTSPSPAAMPTAPYTLPADWQGFAQQHGLYPSQQNVQAYLAEMQQEASDGSIGPTTQDPTSITQLQQALTQLGYPVTASGQYDAATRQAVQRFKQAHGLHQSYLDASGAADINVVADRQTLQLILSLTQAQAQGTAIPQAQPVAPAPANPAVPAPAQAQATTPAPAQAPASAGAQAGASSMDDSNQIVMVDPVTGLAAN